MVRKCIVVGILLCGMTRIFADAVQFNAMDTDRTPIGEDMTISIKGPGMKGQERRPRWKPDLSELIPGAVHTNTQALRSGKSVGFVLAPGVNYELCVKSGDFSQRYVITVRAFAPGEMRTQVVRDIYFSSEHERLQPISSSALVTIAKSLTGCGN